MNHEKTRMTNSDGKSIAVPYAMRKRFEGCPYNHNRSDRNYCIHCGRPLTKKAEDSMVERLTIR